MKMKKVLGLILACSAAVSLAACGGGNDEMAESDHIVKWINYGPDVRELNVVNDAINEYTQEKIGETIDYMTFGSSEFIEKLQMMVATGDRIDLCFSANHRNFNQNLLKGFYMDMTPYFEEYGKDIKALYPDYVYTSGIVDGKMYALPAWKDFAYEYAVGYNLQGMEEAEAAAGMKIEDVKSVAELEPLIAAFKEKHPNDFPVHITPASNFFATLGYIPVGDTSMVGSMNIYKEDGKVVNPYEQEDAKEYFKLMHDWYNKKYMRADVATLAANASTSGKSLVSLSQMLPYQRMVANRTLTDDKKSGDLKLWEPWMISTAGSMQSIPRTAKNPVGAMKFLNLLNTDEYLRNLVALGVEGVHYEKVDDFHFRYVDGKKRDEMGYYSWPYTQGNVYLTMQIEGTPDDIYEKYKEFDDSARPAQNFGFSFNSENLKTEVAAVGNVYNEFIPALVTGSVDPDVYLPQALEKFKVAGLDKVMAEMQTQFDAWKATQK